MPHESSPRAGQGGPGAMAYLLAALGGALGALVRWAVAAGLPSSPGGWPWSTLLVNLTGCFLLGSLSVVLAARFPTAAWPRPFLAVGVLGGYTTYSTFALDVVALVEHGAAWVAAGYVLASVAGGVLAVVAGAVAARSLPRTA